jgi:hypothetical protein
MKARNKLLDLEDLTEAQLEHLKGSFTKLASKGPDNALLREGADDLDTAGAEIREAREKVTTVADGKLAKPDRYCRRSGVGQARELAASSGW